MSAFGISCSAEGLTEIHLEILAAIGTKTQKSATRAEVADLYEMCLMIEPRGQVDWGAINRAIMARWSVSGLTFIKKLAWKRIEGR